MALIRSKSYKLKSTQPIDATSGSASLTKLKPHYKTLQKGLFLYPSVSFNHQSTLKILFSIDLNGYASSAIRTFKR